MDVTSIYKGSKLYTVAKVFDSSSKTEFLIPKNFNGVSVLYEYEAAEALPDSLSGFLDKVLEGGMRQDPARILSANMCYTNVSLQKLAEQARATTVVIFGRKWLNSLKNANIDKNEIVKLFGMKVLITDTLEVISIDDTAKKAFWLQLKKLF
jgi:hypothetical protein